MRRFKPRTLMTVTPAGDVCGNNAAADPSRQRGPGTDHSAAASSPVRRRRRHPTASGYASTSRTNSFPRVTVWRTTRSPPACAHRSGLPWNVSGGRPRGANPWRWGARPRARERPHRLGPPRSLLLRPRLVPVAAHAAREPFFTIRRSVGCSTGSSDIRCVPLNRYPARQFSEPCRRVCSTWSAGPSAFCWTWTRTRP